MMHGRASCFALGLLAAIAVLLATPLAAHAQGPAAQLVLVIANNRGTELSRADLHYADDDGAKYRALFRAAASLPSDVQLLARFDRDTARLFPERPDAAPTRADLEQKVAALVARRAELRREGHEVDFVFVYAGHGDIDRGKGFLQLEDGSFTADDLAALVQRIDATRAHVILDSCNSLFLVSPRKPGGRHVATSDDAVRALRERLPRVGVFLSTSSAGEVFEWSELGAGIFSHAVRSGLSGAADANGDGRVSYAELRAFVDVATHDLKNPRYRPKVFARGPEGDDAASLFTPRSARGRHLLLEGPVRTTLRDAEDIPWLDAHVESGTRVELLLPAALDEGQGTRDILDVSGGSPRVIRREAIDEASALRPQPMAARGPSEIFRTLFVLPFGPRAMAVAEAARGAGDPETYGLSRDDVTRFSILLAQVADAERSRRTLAGLGVLGAGVASGAMGALVLTRNHDRAARSIGVGYAAAGLGLALAAPFIAFKEGAGEALRTDVERERAANGDSTAAVARAEERLFELARKERLDRLLGAAGLGVVLVVEGAAFTFNELKVAPDPQLRGILASGIVLSTVAGIMMLQPTPIERLADVWKQEPARPSSRWSFAPVGPAGLGVTMAARF